LRLLKEYIDFVKKNKRKTFAYSTDNTDKDIESHKGINDNLGVFKKSIANFLKDGSCKSLNLFNPQLLGVLYISPTRAKVPNTLLNAFSLSLVSFFLMALSRDITSSNIVVRPYSWKKDDINRMWEDIVYGLEQLKNSEDYITFLGSVITMHDIKHQSIAPIVRGEMPENVMVVIDGQQRLTTMLLLVKAFDKREYKNISPFRRQIIFAY
jgi:hypothetical protein